MKMNLVQLSIALRVNCAVSKFCCYRTYTHDALRRLSSRNRHVPAPVLRLQPPRSHRTKPDNRYSSSNAAITEAKQRAPITEVRGRSGRLYKVERILQDKGCVRGRVLLATAGGDRYILKEIPPYNYGFRLEIYERLKGAPYIRHLEDEAPDQAIFIFKYFNEHLLSLVQRDLSIATIKQVLKQALQGIATMHARDVIHNDIKPNNIFIQVSGEHSAPTIEQLVVSDLEDSGHCPPPGRLIGLQLGNWMWRSPEAHAEGPMQTPSDMFAFGIVCIYAVTKAIIFGVSEEQREAGVDVSPIVLERQISFFGDMSSFESFLIYLHDARPDNPWIQIFHAIREGFTADNPREPFYLWEEDPPLDEDFTDLISKMTNFNPARRITAQEALDHIWFKEA